MANDKMTFHPYYALIDSDTLWEFQRAEQENREYLKKRCRWKIGSITEELRNRLKVFEQNYKFTEAEIVRKLLENSSVIYEIAVSKELKMYECDNDYSLAAQKAIDEVISGILRAINHGLSWSADSVASELRKRNRKKML